eukprot:snap_masked-scaffold_16-processed-gene-2.13-mRNA-1 protein AED:1.00 eAED:1.00 QI:0/0/0/0/1/1/2/0/221
MVYQTKKHFGGPKSRDKKDVFVETLDLFPRLAGFDVSYSDRESFDHFHKKHIMKKYLNLFYIGYPVCNALSFYFRKIQNKIDVSLIKCLSIDFIGAENNYWLALCISLVQNISLLYLRIIYHVLMDRSDPVHVCLLSQLLSIQIKPIGFKVEFAKTKEIYVNTSYIFSNILKSGADLRKMSLVTYSSRPPQVLQLLMDRFCERSEGDWKLRKENRTQVVKL